jgi:hypothetical protein
LVATALAAACVGAAAQDVPVRRGADWVSAPSVPTQLTVDMRMLPLAPVWKPGDPVVEIPRRFHGDPRPAFPTPVNPTFGDDPLVGLQRAYDTLRGGGSFTTPLLNQDVLASTASPNDPTGDIGSAQFVAATNGPGGGQFAAYNKTTGAVVVPPTLMDGLGSGGICAVGVGDPIVLFDELAFRWVLTEFSDTGNGLCVYISNVADLSGTVTWTRYTFTLPDFPDYPKYGVWPDAYYVGANEGGTASARPLYAMDRVRMLAGQPATLQRVTVPELAGFGFQMIQPADVAGDPPPAGSPGIFMRHRDDESHNSGSNNPAADFLELFEMSVDWTTPANTTVTGPTQIQIAEFSSNLNGLSAFEAFPQPSGTRLDPLRETVMHRLTYRNLGTRQVLFGNLVTDLFNGAGSTFPDDTGGVRWFELTSGPVIPDAVFRNGFEDPAREPAGGTVWTLRQEGTFAPADGTPAEQIDRWMAASAIDAAGNAALAYNVVRQSPALSAGLRYTGRLAGDTLGVMTQPETTIVTGAGNTTNVRWGDYNDMGVDPVDGCTFWFIGNYMNTARANRVAAFRFPSCGVTSFAAVLRDTTASVCANSASPQNSTPIGLDVLAAPTYSGTVTFSVPTPPAGIGGSFVPPTASTFPASTVATLTATNVVPAGTLPVTLRASDGTTTRDVTVTLTAITATLAGPAPAAPANGATNVTSTPTFSWAAVAGATGYVVEASTSSTFATTLFSQNVTGTSLVSPVALPASTQVFWRVRTRNACGEGANSATSSFTTGLPAAPTLTAPANGATGVSTSPTFTWAAANGATGYVVEASISSTFATTLFSQSATGTTLNSPVGLPVSTPIFWRVRATNGYGPGPNSAVFSFTTGAEYCRTPNLAIPDDDTAGVSDVISISGASGTVANLDVLVDIDHTYVGDLNLRLTRVSDNLTINLMSNPETTTSDFCVGRDVRATFDDGATQPAQTGCNDDNAIIPTMNGAFRPEALLSAYNGQSLNGTWRLTVFDNAPPDDGTLLRWCMSSN